MEKFCKLEKEGKTYEHLCLYFSNFSEGKNIYSIDNEIQKKEMEIHTYCSGKDGLDWVKEHAEKERIYLNSVKLLAYGFFVGRVEISINNFLYMIDQHNKAFDEILNKIF